MLGTLLFFVAASVLGGSVEEPLPAPRIVELDVHPAHIELPDRFAYTQLLVDARTETGEVLDVTRKVRLAQAPPHLEIDERGLIRPLADGTGELVLELDGLTVAIPYLVSGQTVAPSPRFLTDVMPIVSRAGCNAGSCHGSADGKKGFKLSLRGYDPQFDHSALTDDMAARRFDRVRPEESLFLLKSTAVVPHEGGQRILPGSRDYESLQAWVKNGARFEPDVARVTSIEVIPRHPIIPREGMSRQVAVLATFGDGRQRDVTAHAFIETGNTEVTEVDDRGLVTALRRGEAAILARYQGNYAAARVLVMGDRSGWSWEKTAASNFIDEYVHTKLRAIRSRPSPLCSDAEFLRRVSLDLTGMQPTSRETRAFLLDRREGRVKRDELIDRLIGSADFIDYWTNKWCDLLQVNPKFLSRGGAERFRGWIESAIASNQRYDRFVNEILTSSGSTYENPEAAYYKILREPDLAMENTTQLFLGIRFNCNKCHDHPFERWTQRDHWRLSAYFARVGRTNVDGAPMLDGAVAQEEMIDDLDEGEVFYPDRNETAPPSFPFEHGGSVAPDANRREALAAWITAAENPYFATSFANRIWSYFMGVGLIEPVDDIRAGNPPTNPELMERLTQEFIDSGFDVRALMRTICRSRTYQRSVETNEWNLHDETNFSHALARRLPSEVLFDALHRAAGVRPQLPGERLGTRAVQLVDANVETPDNFLQLFGRPPRESACECERDNGMSLGQALNLVNGPTIGDAVSSSEGGIAELAAFEKDPLKIVEELFLSFLCRFPTEEELNDLAPTLVASDPLNLAALDPTGANEHATRRAAWEEGLLPLAEWRTLKPVTAVSSGAAKMTIRDDDSVLVAGGPEKDVYDVVVSTDLSRITGLRIEALPDEELPLGGPGRNGSGNFVLSELRVNAVPVASPQEARPITLRNASADFSQDGWPVGNSIDGDDTTGWAVHPNYGVAHAAVYEVAEELDFEGGALLIFNLAQHYGSNHTLGSLRISVTDSERPVRHHGLDEDVVRAVNVPAAERTPEDEALIHAHFISTQPDLADAIRLAGTQDLAWALANSPAFLFNH